MGSITCKFSTSNYKVFMQIHNVSRVFYNIKMDIFLKISNIVFNNQICNAFPILDNIFMLMIKRTKGNEIAIYYTDHHIWFKHVFGLQKYIFSKNGMEIMDKFYGGYKVN